MPNFGNPMSKIGRLPITLPPSVTLSITGKVVDVKGPQGELTHTIPPHISVTLKEDICLVARDSDDKSVRALHGLTRALLANMVTGVSTGFSKSLELLGTGYRVRLEGNKLVLSLGFSHEINFIPPANITLRVENTNTIIISGADRQAVGQVAAKIRAYKPPEPYKGKGIRYSGETVRRKAGKAAKAATAA